MNEERLQQLKGSSMQETGKGALIYGLSVWESCTDRAFLFVSNVLPCGHTQIVSHFLSRLSMEMLRSFRARAVSLLCVVKTRVQPQQITVCTHQPALCGHHWPWRLLEACLGKLWGKMAYKHLTFSSVTQDLLRSTSTATKETHFHVPT